MSRTIDSTGRRRTTPAIARGTIVIFHGAAIPDGWALCDGTGGTPDLRDRMIVADSAIGLGTAGGSVSATAALTHAGAAIGNHDPHAVTQPAGHSAHAVTQPAAHSAHAVTQAADHPDHAANATHTHDAHTTSTSIAGAQSVIAAHQHAGDGAHTHDAHPPHAGADLDAHSAHTGADLDAHSAHAGAAVDAHSAHSVTQPSSHAIAEHYLLAYIMKL